MFGLSPTKILFTALIIAVVWYGFKWLNRMQQGQNKRSSSNGSDARAQAAQAKSQDADYEELVACAKCGDYVIADKKSGCGKDGCPYDK